MTKDFEETSELRNTPANVLPIAEILKIANPSLYTRRIIDFALGIHHDLEFERVVMLNPGGENCQFAVSSSLYPNPGGSSGIPWTYRSWVRGDGKKIEPQIYLWDCWSIDSRSDINLRCHIALKDLTPAKGKAKLVGDQIQKIAAEGLDSILTKPSGSDQPLPKFRFHSQKLIEGLPDRFQVWEVAFVDEQIAKQQDPNAFNNFRIWVTVDGRIGVLSFGPASVKEVNCDPY